MSCPNEINNNELGQEILTETLTFKICKERKKILSLPYQNQTIKKQQIKS